MHSLTCMSVVVCVVRKPRPCNSYSRRRDRINSVLWRSYYKGGGGKNTPQEVKFEYTGFGPCESPEYMGTGPTDPAASVRNHRRVSCCRLRR